MKHPKARTTGLVTTELDGELLVYDRRTHRALCLNPTAVAVWRRADGTRSADQLAADLSFELGRPIAVEVVWYALARLNRASLLEECPEPPALPQRCTRRSLARQLGTTLAFSSLVPAITAIIAPTAAQAATCKGYAAACTSNAQCCSGRCHAVLKRCMFA